MLILSRVCADFHDAHGNIVYSVTTATRNTFQHAPETIQEDPLFDLLIKEGSLEAGITQARQKQMENDPTAGHDATGKLIPPEMTSEVVETDNASGADAGSTPASVATSSGSGKNARNKKAEPAG